MAIHIPGLIAIIVFYLLILGIGLWAARKTGLSRKSTNTEDVMLAGRNIGLFVGCFTMTATWVGGGYINGSAEIVMGSGLVWCQAPIGYSLSLICGGIFFAKKMRSMRYTTMLDPFQKKYGDLMGALLYLPALTGEVFWSGAILSALGATLAVILDLETKIAIIVSACIALVYTMLGGLYSVAYTDVVQLICMFVGLWLSVPFALTNDAVTSITVDAKSTWIQEVAHPDIGLYIDGFVLLICGGIPWQVYFQRVLSARTSAVAQGLSFVAAFGCFIMAIPAILIGAIGASTDWNQTSYRDVGTIPIPSTDLSLILPLVLRYLCPVPVAFIGLGAVSAAVMSSTDSSILSASSMFAWNIFAVVYSKVAGRKPSQMVTVWVMRLSQVAVAALACAMAITVTSIYYLFYLCSDLVFVLLFPQLTCAVYLEASNPYGSLAGYILGLLFRLLGGEPSLGMPAAIKFPWYSESKGQRFPFKTMSMLISLFTIIIVSYITRFLFKSKILPDNLDIFGCYRKSSIHAGENAYVIDQPYTEEPYNRKGMQETDTNTSPVIHFKPETSTEKETEVNMVNTPFPEQKQEIRNGYNNETFQMVPQENNDGQISTRTPSFSGQTVVRRPYVSKVWVNSG